MSVLASAQPWLSTNGPTQGRTHECDQYGKSAHFTMYSGRKRILWASRILICFRKYSLAVLYSLLNFQYYCFQIPQREETQIWVAQIRSQSVLFPVLQ